MKRILFVIVAAGMAAMYACDPDAPCLNDCNDGNACTDDECLGGQCWHVPVNCDDGSFCTTDGCDSLSGCFYTIIPDCDSCPDDGDPCTDDFQDEFAQCVHMPKDCNDNDECTNDQCSGGICDHSPYNCDDANSCTNDVCINPTVGCEFEPIPGCTGNCSNCIDDGDPCTIDCTNGVCNYLPINCDDGNECTYDQCAGGTCSYTPYNCDDNDPATVDQCDPVNGCFYVAQQ